MRDRTGGVCHYDMKWLEGGRFYGFAAGAGRERGSCGAPFVAASAVVGGFHRGESLVERGTVVGCARSMSRKRLHLRDRTCGEALGLVRGCGRLRGKCVGLGYVELEHAADFGAAGMGQFCGGWWAAGYDEHVPFLN
jgi:hypothetical protein